MLLVGELTRPTPSTVTARVAAGCAWFGWRVGHVHGGAAVAEEAAHIGWHVAVHHLRLCLVINVVIATVIVIITAIVALAILSRAWA